MTVAGIGMIFTVFFLEDWSVNAWLAAHIFFFLGVLFAILGK